MSTNLAEIFEDQEGAASSFDDARTDAVMNENVGVLSLWNELADLVLANEVHSLSHAISETNKAIGKKKRTAEECSSPRTRFKTSLVVISPRVDLMGR